MRQTKDTAMSNDVAAFFAPPAPEELARRKKAVARVLAVRAQTPSIAPCTTADHLVVDASVGAKWHLPDEQDIDIALQVLDQYQIGRVALIAPTAFLYVVVLAINRNRAMLILRTVQKAVGHASLDTTSQCVHLARGRLGREPQ